MKTIDRAKKYAQRYHLGQVDKAGIDYFSGHVMTVAQKVAMAGYGDTHVVVAFLHDVVEDTASTLEEISSEFGVNIANSVDAMTKRNGEVYDDYLKRIVTNRVALVVKFYDMEHNSDLGRLVNVREKDLKRKEKYSKYMKVLEAYL